jgi:hypothetical protein
MKIIFSSLILRSLFIFRVAIFITSSYMYSLYILYIHSLQVKSGLNLSLLRPLKAEIFERKIFLLVLLDQYCIWYSLSLDYFRLLCSV